MAKAQFAGGILLFALFGLAIGYVVAAGFLTFRLTGQIEQINWFILFNHWSQIRAGDPQAFRIAQIVMGAFAMAAILLSGHLLSERLTLFGRSHWQTKRELKKNGFFQQPGKGFVLAKMGDPKSQAKFLSSASFPHCLVVAPTGRGKGTGFVIPNLLTFAGSAVVLDVKGENYEKTSRRRGAMGDKVWRFAPVDWENPTHRYNPLDRIAALPNANQQQMELRKTANLFLQSDSDDAKGLLEGGIDLFVACGIYALELGRPTLGEIYRLAASGGNKQAQYSRYADEVKSRAAALIFERLGSTNDKTLTSYLSLLMTSGLSAWDNPAIDAATEMSDFDFKTFRTKPQTVYLIVPPDDIKPLAPLIRLFFADLIATLQAKEPGPTEPWPVMILLDEFDRLGKMPIVAESIKTLRSYKGHLAIVTQTIPALDEIYGKNTRLSLQGGAGVKVYMTPSEEMTVQELSAAVGKTTKRVVSKSRTVGRGRLEGTNVSERTEEAPLLPEDEARRLDLDDIILVIDGQHPARAKRIKYYDDKVLAPIFESQSGTFPMPDMAERELADIKKRLAAQEARMQSAEPERAEEIPSGKLQRQRERLSLTPEIRDAVKISIAKGAAGGAARVLDKDGMSKTDLVAGQAAPESSGDEPKPAAKSLKRRRPVSEQVHQIARLMQPTDENGVILTRMAFQVREVG